MSFHDHFQTTCSKVYPINLRKETCCLFSCQHPRCWESRIKWFYHKVLLIPGFPYHRSLLYGEILKNSKLFSSADFNAHPYIHTKQEMQPKSVNENHHYLQPLSEKLLHFIEQRRLCQKLCQNINQDLLVHTSNRHIGEFDHRRKKDEQEPPSPEQSQNRNIEAMENMLNLTAQDIKHDQPETSANTKQLDGTQPGGSKLEKCSKNHTQSSSISICDTNKDVEYFPHALIEAVVKNTEPEKSESAGTSKEGTVEVSPNPSITSAHSLESHLTEEKYSSICENEDSNTTSLREMFPDLPIPDENLSLKRLQQMSTTDITKQIVSLHKPAILKPTNRLIPQSKIWLSPLQEVDKQQEAEAEKEIVPWDSNPTDQESDSESSEEIELNIDLEDDGKA